MVSDQSIRPISAQPSLVSRYGHRHRRHRGPASRARQFGSPEIWLFYSVISVASLAYFFSGRDLGLIRDLAAADDLPMLVIGGRLANTIGLVCCLAALVRIISKGVVGRGAIAIATATLFYYSICFLMPAAFDPNFLFDQKLLYPIAALLIILSPTAESVRGLAIHFARAASIPAAMSLLLMLVQPSSAVLGAYDSLLPFFSGRLYGVAAHANVLGSVCSLAILLIAAFPSGWRAERVALLAINSVVLLLCQSKTAWLMTLLGLLIIYLPRYRRFSRRDPVSAGLALMAGLSATVLMILSVLNASVYEFWAENRNLEQLATMTGRTDIWGPTLLLIDQNPIVGPGWASYLRSMQALYPDMVPDPHNLYLATLVQAGAIGVVALAIFLGTLLAAAVKVDRPIRPFALACVTLIWLRGISESSTFQTAFTAPTFWTLLMIMRLLSVANARQLFATTRRKCVSRTKARRAQ